MISQIDLSSAKSSNTSMTTKSRVDSRNLAGVNLFKTTSKRASLDKSLRKKVP